MSKEYVKVIKDVGGRYRMWGTYYIPVEEILKQDNTNLKNAIEIVKIDPLFFTDLDGVIVEENYDYDSEYGDETVDDKIHVLES